MQYEFFRVAVVHDSRERPTKLVEEKVHEIAAEGWRLIQVLVETPATIPTEYVIIAERAREA